MTRLAEALDRARTTRDKVPLASTESSAAIPTDGASTSVNVPRAWHFDDEITEPDINPHHELTLDEPPEVSPEAFQYRFGESAAGKVVVGSGADSDLVEQYRRLAAVLHHSQLQRGVRSVMVASAVMAEGKSLTSTNLALILSHSYQRRVLLIDADLRRPSIHEMFRLENRVGLGDGLKHPEIGRLPVQRISPTLWVLTAGRPNPDPMSALVSDTMKQLLKEASEQFDWVVVDTPPVALMPDANLLAGMIDTALVVVSANSTPYPLVKRITEAIGPARILGVVLNRAEKADLMDGDGYYRYYNQYRAPRETGAGSGFRLFGRRIF